MKIQTVRIRNFRTLKDVTIPFDSVTTFIGPNGAGKSTVLRALDWFFNGKPGPLTDKDCSFGATGESIEVQVTFSDLTPTDISALGKYASNAATTFTAWRIRSPDGGESLSANAKSYGPFNAIRGQATATDKRKLYNELRSQDTSLDLPAWTSQDAAAQTMATWEAAHTDQLETAPEALQTNFFGFNSGGKMSGLFDFVLVTADLRASEESVDGKSSIIARILERSLDRAAADAEIATIVEESRVKQQKVYEEKFKGQLEVMTGKLNDVVASYSPGRQINVAPSDIELKAPKTTFEMTILDGSTVTSVDRQGHGFQRTLLISALQLLAQSGAASDEGVICLAIEEPELFQHPIQAQTFAKVLRSLADDVSKRIQVTYATHSPYFLEARHFDQVRRLTRTLGSTSPVSIHHTSMNAVKAKLAGFAKPEVVERQLDMKVTNDLAIALFSNRVLIVEGTTEASVLYGVGDRAAVGALEAAGLSIVPANGKGSIPLIHAILSLIGIPTYALFDADRGFAARAKDEEIESVRKGHVSTNRLLLKYFGLQEDDFPAETASDRVAIFGDHLETHMQENWPEWVDACASVEDEAGMKLAKNQAAYRVATLRATGTVPNLLNEILAKALGK